MMMIVEQSVECELAGETEILVENLPKFNKHFQNKITEIRLI
jgi:hypothetical protein